MWRYWQRWATSKSGEFSRTRPHFIQFLGMFKVLFGAVAVVTVTVTITGIHCHRSPNCNFTQTHCDAEICLLFMPTNWQTHQNYIHTHTHPIPSGINFKLCLPSLPLLSIYLVFFLLFSLFLSLFFKLSVTFFPHSLYVYFPFRKKETRRRISIESDGIIFVIERDGENQRICMK